MVDALLATPDNAVQHHVDEHRFERLHDRGEAPGEGAQLADCG
jgi:hypothetical protein